MRDPALGVFDRTADVNSYKKANPCPEPVRSPRWLILLLCGAVRPRVHCVSRDTMWVGSTMKSFF
jgi:hypothetical protein